MDWELASPYPAHTIQGEPDYYADHENCEQGVHPSPRAIADSAHAAQTGAVRQRPYHQ